MKIIGKPIVIPKQKQARKFAPQAGWRNIGGRDIYFRSEWEVKYAHYLQFLKEKNIIQEWEHEPRTFWFDQIKRGTRSFLPDFKVTKPDGTHYWVEVKGYMDSKSNTKIKRFNKYFPEEELHVIDKKWFTARGKFVSQASSIKSLGSLRQQTN